MTDSFLELPYRFLQYRPLNFWCVAHCPIQSEIPLAES